MNAKTKTRILFLLPSLLGVFLFVTPLPVGGQITLPVAYLAKALQNLLAGKIPAIMTLLSMISVLITVALKISPSLGKRQGPFLALFDVTLPWALLRALGATFALLAWQKLGPHAIWSDTTGGLLLHNLLPILFSVFFFAGLLLPLLLDFGLLELCSALFSGFMRPIFTLPGRSAIDCLASWLGDGTVGVLLTSKQYEEGFYSAREACVIGSSFSIVSMTFCIVVLSYVRLDHLVAPYFISIFLSGFVIAIICPRIPPLSRKPQSYLKENSDRHEKVPEGCSALKHGLQLAEKRAANAPSLIQFFRQGLLNVLDMWMGVVPIVLAVGTMALMAAELTPVFDWLAIPFAPILELMGVPLANEAAKTVVVGFADMFLPAILGAQIENEFTRFVIASLSVSQLIYMSEVGGLLLGSKIPLSFVDLAVIFLQRTFIALPIIVLVGHCVF